jgi:hypothetical protein
MENKKLGRPKVKSPKIRDGYSLDQDVVNAVIKLSEESGISRSKIVNDLLRKVLELKKSEDMHG